MRREGEWEAGLSTYKGVGLWDGARGCSPMTGNQLCLGESFKQPGCQGKDHRQACSVPQDAQGRWWLFCHKNIAINLLIK